MLISLYKKKYYLKNWKNKLYFFQNISNKKNINHN